jgi:hypothetical protein
MSDTADMSSQAENALMQASHYTIRQPRLALSKHILIHIRNGSDQDDLTVTPRHTRRIPWSRECLAFAGSSTGQRRELQSAFVIESEGIA